MAKKQKKRQTSIFSFKLNWRKLLFFASVFLVIIISYAGIKDFKASTNDYIPAGSSYGSLNMALEIMKNGSVYVDGKKIKERIHVVDGFEELRFPILDNYGQYYSNVQITLKLPAAVAKQTKYQIKGIHGVGAVSSNIYDSNTIIYTAQDLEPTATLSIIAQMPEGTIKLGLNDRLMFLLSNIKYNAWVGIGIILPIFTLLYMFLFISFQVRKARIDQPTEDSAAPPMALPPAIVGVLFRQKVTSREIAATLISLAERGDLFILDRERGFSFLKNRQDMKLLTFEKILLSKIFKEEKDLVSHKHEIEKRIGGHLYSKKISIFASMVYSIATGLGYFRINPQKMHAKFQLIGIAGLFIGFGGFLASLKIFTNPPFIVFFWVGMMVSALIITVTAKNIPIRSPLGQAALSNWLAFKKYLSKQEKMPYTYNSQEVFQKYLPYAIVLDCEVAWAKRFSEQNFILPDWFVTEKNVSLRDFCLSLFPIISFISTNFESSIEPGME